MAWLIDTNIAIHLRDGDTEIVDRVNALSSRPFLSVIARIELENGVYAQPNFMAKRRAALKILLTSMTVLDFDAPAALSYCKIVAHCGYSRRRILDRMIAATALAADLTLITLNGADFRDIPNLKLEAW